MNLDISTNDMILDISLGMILNTRVTFYFGWSARNLLNWLKSEAKLSIMRSLKGSTEVAQAYHEKRQRLGSAWTCK